MKPREMPLGVLNDVAKMYGHKLLAYLGSDSGYRNVSHFFQTSGGERLNFILYKNEPGVVDLIERTNSLGRHVAERGLPVRQPVDSRIIRVGVRYGSLYGYLRGQTIPWEAYTMKHIKLLGYGLAKFHEAARGYEGDLPNVEDVYLDINLRMAEYYGETDVREATRSKLGLYISLPDFNDILRTMKRHDSRQALHMDFVRSNLLFAETGELAVGSVAMSGILDLEKAARGHVLFDVARTLAFLLVDCDRPEEKTRKYFLLSGYTKRGEGRLDEINYQGKDVLESLLDMFLFYDLYKLLRQNPYEFLLENHHYRRTVAVLRARKVL